jgi:DNA-binding XRE family transcriptional regulator
VIFTFAISSFSISLQFQPINAQSKLRHHYFLGFINPKCGEKDTEDNYLVKYSLHNRYFYAIGLNMINNSVESLLLQLGERLKEARLARNESQELFAQRLGLTRQSYSKMEKGSPQTLIGNWLEASSILGRLDDWQDVLAEKEDLFAKFEKKSGKRQRAGGRRKRKTGRGKND